jgi:Malic enzyme, NAD binding domain
MLGGRFSVELGIKLEKLKTSSSNGSSRRSRASRPYVANHRLLISVIRGYATLAVRVTDEMFMTAAHPIAERVAEADLEHGLVYPPQSTLRDSEIHTACRVAEVIFARGLARVPPSDDLRVFIETSVYRPRYETLV